MKKTKALGLALISALSVMTLGTACNTCNQATQTELKFNADLNAELQEKYDPQIEVTAGKIVSVVLRNDESIVMETDSAYAFTPDAIGKYYYTIVIEGNGERKEYVKTITVADTAAPTVVTKPTETKTVEAGVYSGFANDLAEIEITDNNLPMLQYATKKAVSITNGTATETNADGFETYLFNAVGEYTVKVELKDIAGNIGYTDYKLQVVDTTAPVINNLPLQYVWLDGDGQITVPQANVRDMSAVTVETQADKTITDGKINAAVGDVVTVTYKATDALGNESTKTVRVKVLEKGQLIDKTDAELTALFMTDTGVLEQSGGLSYVDVNTSDKIEWIDGAYTFGSVKEFSGLAFKLVNHEYADVELLVAAKVNGEKQYVGSISVPAKGATTTAQTFVLDLTKSGLDEVDGWSYELRSASSLRVDFEELYFTSFSDGYVTANVKDGYQKGERFTYTTTQNGDEIYETEITLKKGTETVATLNGEEDFAFPSAGAYTAQFAFDYGNKIFTTTCEFTVSGGATVSLNGALSGGRVGKAYALPVATSDDGAVTVKVFAPTGGEVALSNGAFTPTTHGNHTVKYYVDGVETTSYIIYIESANELSFESALTYATEYDGGLVRITDGNYATQGKTSAKAQLKALRRTGGLFSEAITLSGNVNYATLDVYANLFGKIKIGFVIDGKTYTSSDLTVEKGANAFGFVLGKSLADKLNNAKLEGIVIYNQSKYANVVYVDNVQFTEKSSASKAEIFGAESKTYYAQTGGTFVVPNPIQCDEKLLSAVSAKIVDGSNNEILAVRLDEIVTLNGVAAGNYAIEYTAESGGVKHTHKLQLVVGTSLLTAELNLGDYYVDEEFSLPAPELYSDVYDETTLANATVRKFYRVPSGLEWIEADGAFTFNQTGYVDVKYTVSVGESKLALYGQTYIHSQGVQVDFEKWSGGDYMGYKVGYNGERFAQISEEWAYDGKYSLKFFGPPSGTADIAGPITREKDEDPIQLGFEADTLVFWFYSEMNCADIHVEVGYGPAGTLKWTPLQWLKLEKGLHKIIVPLGVKIDNYKSVVLRTNTAETYYIDNVSLVKLGEAGFPNVDGNEYFVAEGITLARPTVGTLSKLAFTAEELAAAKFSVEYQTIDGTVVHVFEEGMDEMKLNLAKGTYALTFKCEVAGMTFTETQTIKMRYFPCSFPEPQTVYAKNTEYLLDLPTTTETGVETSAFYRKRGESSWTQLTKVDDQAKLCLTESGNYEIKLVAAKGEQTEEEIYVALVRADNTILDLELNPDGTHHGMGKSSNAPNAVVSDEWSYDGKYSLKITTRHSEDWGNTSYTDSLKETVSLGGAYNMFTVHVYSEIAQKNWRISLHDGTRYYESSVDIKAGEGTYTFVFNKTFTAISKLEFLARNTGAIYVDCLQGGFIETSMPEIQSEAQEGDSVRFGAATASLDGKAQQIKVSYKGEHESDYTPLEFTDGAYTVVSAPVGEMTIKIEVILDNGATVVYTYEVAVYPAPDDPYVEDQEWLEF